MYIDQAQSYDKALLEGWKSDMDGMMLFVCLPLPTCMRKCLIKISLLCIQLV